jgi:hypothetical protein
MNNIVEKPSPRVEEERSRRRRRDDMGDGRFRNLAVVGTMDPDYEYRWINDEPGRVHNLTVRDDWDPVTDQMLGARSEKDKGVGSGVERIVDKATGQRAVLVRKRKDYALEDRAKAQRHIDELDAMIKQGHVPAVGGQGQESLRPGVNAYVPAGGIVIQDGRRN